MLIENLRVLLKSNVKRLPRVDLCAKCFQGVAKGFLSGFCSYDALTEQFESLRKWNASTHQRRPLPRENAQCFGRDGFALLG